MGRFQDAAIASREGLTPLNAHRSQPSFIQFEVHKSNTQLQWHNSSSDKCSREGWLAPAQCALHSRLNVMDIERGQATLPYCIYLSLSYFSAILRLTIMSDESFLDA